MRGKVIVMALRVHHSNGCAQSTAVALLQAREGGTWVAEDAVEIISKRVIEQAHAGVDVFPKGGGFAEMLAKDQGVISCGFSVEVTVAMIGVGKPVGIVELELGVSCISGRAGILIGP